MKPVFLSVLTAEYIFFQFAVAGLNGAGAARHRIGTPNKIREDMRRIMFGMAP